MGEHAAGSAAKPRAGARLALVSESSDTTLIDEIRSGYAFEGAALEFGAAVLDGTAHPDAVVRIPCRR